MLLLTVFIIKIGKRMDAEGKNVRLYENSYSDAAKSMSMKVYGTIVA
jgi:hypothetical protein